MRRITWTIAIVVCVALVLTGCGKKDAGAVVKELDAIMNEMTSYQGTGTMTLHTSVQPQRYEVEVWYQAPHYYRIALTNAKKDVTQIVLRNDEGVFVLTPQLNKSFRFQSDWPEKQGQAYLYHTLVQSILQDKSRQFTQDGENYVFDVASNLQNHSLKRQRVWLNKKSYAPVKMEALDAGTNVLLDVKFNSFSFNKKFDQDSFDMQRNMTSFEIYSLPRDAGDANSSIPTILESDEDQALAAKPVHTGAFGVLQPTYLPEGVVLKELSDLKLGEDKGILLRYGGEYSFTITESRPKDRAASALSGTIIDMGFAFGALLGDERKTLTWMEDGVEFRLSSADLPQEEMVNIAQSMQDQIGK